MQSLKIKVTLFLLIVFFIGCARPQVPISIEPPIQAEEPAKNITPTKDECTADTDCFPATCCHPSACVPIGKEPSCFDAVCTDECRQVSMDCGQGKCECVNKKCTAVIYS